ncbi:MCE family protein [Thermoleophilia bacterium SCSIO 60948]|nr:MCE family protein [Thermoleophilia bacterium SCSIO 60948]
MSPRPQKAPNPHLDPRGASMTKRWVVGLFVVIALAIVGYLAFFKNNPFVGPGYQATAVFENATTLRSSAPVRIAGVNVGEVTDIELEGETSEVTFTVDDEGLPLHEDATVEIRPRLFLEGNFFLELTPGSPTAPDLPDGGKIPVTQTTTAVQIDEVLTALQASSRRDLQKSLDGFGAALNERPSSKQDRTQDPEFRGLTLAETINKGFKYGGPAGKTTSIVNQALLGNEPHDLSRLIKANATVFGALSEREEDLQGLITNFNTVTGALATEQENLRATLAELQPTLETAEPALINLNTSFPPLRAFSRELEPSLRALPGTISAGNPWLRQARPLLSNRELGGLAKLLERGTPGLAKSVVVSQRLFPELTDFSRCVDENLIPTGDIVVDDAGGAYPYTTGESNYSEFLYALVNQAGESASFDGNGPYLRANAGGGGVLAQAAPPSGGSTGTADVFSNVQTDPVGTRPRFTPEAPPYRPDVSCFTNPLPNVNGVGAGDLPGDIGPPMPEAVGP